MKNLFLLVFLLLARYKQTTYPFIQYLTIYQTPVKIHYLGHSSFVFSLDNGKTILIDYGQSNAYGLISPVFEYSGFTPDIVLFTHRDADHDRGASFIGSKVIQNKKYMSDGIEIIPYPVSERKANDNCGYLITYKGLRIFHAGDIQGDMLVLKTDSARQTLKDRIPGRLDLILVPIGFIKDIVKEAADFVEQVDARKIIPMHYWTDDDKNKFLKIFSSLKENYFVTAKGNSELTLDSEEGNKMREVISLEPGKMAR